MSNIPEARRFVKVALTDLKMAIRVLKKAQKLMTRPAPVRRAKPNSKKCTPELAEKIRKMAHKYPGLSFRQIATHFDVDAGRVSEAMRNLR